MRKSLLFVILAALPCVVSAQALGAIAGTGQQAGKALGRLSGPLGGKTAEADTRTESYETPEPVPTPPGARKAHVTRRASPVKKAAAPAPPPPAYVAESAVLQMKAGMSRADVLTALGKADQVAGIQGLPDGGRETFTYWLSDGRAANIKMVNRVVVDVKIQ